MEQNKLFFQSCDGTYQESKVVIFSAPMDTTTSFRPGTRFAGNELRLSSFGLEWYSPYLDASLKDYKTADIGDLDLTIGDVEKNLEIIEKTTDKIIKDGKIPLLIGGEHLVSLGAVRATYNHYPNMVLLHFDAHTDLRDSFFGMKLSHASVIRRIHDFLGDGRIYQFGIRSGDKEEFTWAASHLYMEKFTCDSLDEIIQKVKHLPVYITIDIDILDPSIFPGTGTPEPGGISFVKMLEILKSFTKLENIVGADIVELSPHYDSSGVSSLVAGKILRELILVLHKQNN